MAHLNHKGPENKGSKTGRMLGLCSKTREEQEASAEAELGKGLSRSYRMNCSAKKGLRRRSADFFEKGHAD